MTQPQVVVDLTKASEPETNGSRKHDRHEQDSQADGTSKRAKLQRASEPPSCKDTSTIPKTKHKKSRKKINPHKVSRTNNYHEVKKSNEALQREVVDTKQEIMKHEIESKGNAAELKRVRKICDEKAEERRKQLLTIQSLKNECEEKDQGLKAKDVIIAALRKELDEARQDREQAMKETEAARTLNDSNGARNHQIAKREQTAKEKLKDERKEHQNQALAFEEENKELQQKLQDLKNWYNEKIAGLQRELQDSRQQSQRFNFKVPDDKVTQDFTALRSKIRQFVYKHTRPGPTPTDEELQLIWPGWSPALRNFLASPILCNLVFEAYIWKHLLVRIFSPWSKIWAGDLGQSLEDVLSMAGVESERAGIDPETYTHYQYLRSSSSSFISRLRGEDFRLEDLDPDVDAVLSTLIKLSRLPEVTGAMKTEAIGIFERARAFEIQLRKLKAAYSFCMSKPLPSGEVLKYGFHFDDKSMIDRSPDPSDQKHGSIPVVDFIMSPGLHKRGNNDGEEYEGGTSCVVKMGVVYDAARFFVEPDCFTVAQPTLAQVPKAHHSGEVRPKDEDLDIVAQSYESCTKNEINVETPISDSKNDKVDDTDSELALDPSSTSVLISDSLAPGSHDAALIQSSTTTDVMTRNHTLHNADSNVQEAHHNTRSKSNHLFPTGAAKGRGGGRPAKRKDPSLNHDTEPDRSEASDVRFGSAASGTVIARVKSTKQSRNILEETT